MKICLKKMTDCDAWQLNVILTLSNDCEILISRRYLFDKIYGAKKHVCVCSYRTNYRIFDKDLFDKHLYCKGITWHEVGRHPKVHELDVCVRGLVHHEDVLRLDVAVQDAVSVAVQQRLHQRLAQEGAGGL